MTIATNDSGQTVYLTDAGAWEPAQTAVNPQTKEMLAFDGKDWQPVKAKSKGVLSYIDDAVRSLASGATFGFADEIAAKGNELIGRGTYDENLASEKARDAQISPWMKIPGEIAGAVGSSLATAPVTAPLAAATGLSKLPALVRAAGVGAGAGGLFGAGEAEPGGRMVGAATGAAIGVPAGIAGYGAARAIGSGANAIRGALSPQANVASDLGRAIERDAMSPDQLLRRTQELQATRPGVATVADAGGENVKGLVERIAQTPGAGRTTVIPALTDRQQGQMARVANDLRSLTGTNKTATQAISDTMEQRAKDAKPLYDEAFNFNALENPEIVRAWQQEISTGYGRAFLMRPEFRKILQTEYGIKDPTNAPLMVQIDAWKKVADDFVGNNLGSNQARVVQKMRERVLDVVDQHNPKYAEARNAWAGPSQYLDAVKEGQNLLSTKVSGEQLAAGLEGMTDVQREAYRIGAVSAVIAKMGNDPAKLGDMTKYLRSPEARAKIAAIMPTAEARATWTDRLNFEVGSSEMTGRALGNSATARRLAERQDADSIAGDLVMDAFMGSPPASLLRQLVSTVPKRIRDTLRSRSDAILGELLTDPASMHGLRQAIERVQARGAPRQPAIGPGATAATIGESSFERR